MDKTVTKFRRLALFALLVLVSALVVTLAIVWFSPATSMGHSIENLLGASSTSQFPTAPALCPTEPMPSYVVVYPKPEQIITISSESQMMVIKPDKPHITTFNIPIEWEPGFVCVVLDAADLLEPGDFWELADVTSQSSLLLNSQRLEMAPVVVDGIIDHQLTFYETADDGTEKVIGTASTGGPYGMCWEGPWEEGEYVAEFAFEDNSYSWWYRIEE
jgi:hypothetical protein